MSSRRIYFCGKLIGSGDVIVIIEFEEGAEEVSDFASCHNFRALDFVIAACNKQWPSYRPAIYNAAWVSDKLDCPSTVGIVHLSLDDVELLDAE